MFPGIVRTALRFAIADSRKLRVATVSAKGKASLNVSRDLGNVVASASGFLPEYGVIESPPDSVVAGEAVQAAKLQWAANPPAKPGPGQS